jgi:4'-phosphopantetheinyl transferase
VNATRWQPQGGTDGPEFQFLLSLIDTSDASQVGKYRKEEDRKRALLSRLMARQASAKVLGLGDFADIRIARTLEGKPYLKAPRPRDELANFNFNISHEGDWVVLASEPRCVCGVDVSAPEDCGMGAKTDVFNTFREQLSPAEWEQVRRKAAEGPSQPGADPTYDCDAFQRYWSCKEAFVKARGDGLAFEPLGRAEFSFRGKAATVRVDGREMPHWRFFSHRLGEDHWVTVARGPPEHVVDREGGFRATLGRGASDFSPKAWKAELAAESPAFVELRVTELVPEDRAAEFAAIAGGSPNLSPNAVFSV